HVLPGALRGPEEGPPGGGSGPDRVVAGAPGEGARGPRGPRGASGAGTAMVRHRRGAGGPQGMGGRRRGGAVDGGGEAGGGGDGVSGSLLICVFSGYTILFMSTKSRGRGRPRKSPHSSKSKSILFRLEPKEKEGFGQAATLAGVPLAVWIRERLRRIATSELKEVGRQAPFLSGLTDPAK